MTHILKNGLLCDYDELGLIKILHLRMRNFFRLSSSEMKLIREKHSDVLDRLQKCFCKVDNKYYQNRDKTFFSTNHSGQYLAYLYFYSLEFSLLGHELKEKFYYLNKILHSVDIYSEVRLPEVFFFEHPLGMVLGRANYGDNFFAMQGCTVGGNKGKYPIIGNNVKMFSNAKIVGNCIVGNNVWISANTYLKDCNVPANTIVFGQSPNLIFKELKQ
ncbi:transferase [Olivibacter sp. LS-1]|uniref:transferase n=1 Tax=unclassified Olivibacter TaxID=2632301 RepID=UPI0011EADFAE|nr:MULTISPECIES: transferase [unclassified Olivibacter]MDM8177213.1 hypothetical protein [Olivibacter sp. 47]QEL00371.1 transferase [Olivibacter sp. LS-1]